MVRGRWRRVYHHVGTGWPCSDRCGIGAVHHPDGVVNGVVNLRGGGGGSYVTGQRLLELLDGYGDLVGKVCHGLCELLALGARVILPRGEVTDEHPVDLVELQLVELVVQKNELILKPAQHSSFGAETKQQLARQAVVLRRNHIEVTLDVVQLRQPLQRPGRRVGVFAHCVHRQNGNRRDDAEMTK